MFTFKMFKIHAGLIHVVLIPIAEVALAWAAKCRLWPTVWFLGRKYFLHPPLRRLKSEMRPHQGDFQYENAWHHFSYNSE
jgi:hypothetical protein